MKNKTISIIGLGYVGLPLAVAFAKKKYKVIGFGISQKRIDELNKGIDSYPLPTVIYDIKSFFDKNIVDGRL